MSQPDMAGVPRMWADDFYVRPAQPGDGEAIGRIHREAMRSDYVHPDGLNGATQEAVDAFVHDSLWRRKPGPYWDGAIEETQQGVGEYTQILVACTSIDDEPAAFGTDVFAKDNPELAELDALYGSPTRRRIGMGSALARTVLGYNERGGLPPEDWDGTIKRATLISVTSWAPALVNFYVGFGGAMVLRDQVRAEKASPQEEFGITLLQTDIVLWGLYAWQAGPAERARQAEIVKNSLE